ncbi:hypothetical protein GEMRC1_005844 [Eukaryota sp. GEM-RC1]
MPLKQTCDELLKLSDQVLADFQSVIKLSPSSDISSLTNSLYENASRFLALSQSLEPVQCDVPSSVFLGIHLPSTFTSSSSANVHTIRIVDLLSIQFTLTSSNTILSLTVFTLTGDVDVNLTSSLSSTCYSMSLPEFIEVLKFLSDHLYKDPCALCGLFTVDNTLPVFIDFERRQLYHLKCSKL